MTDNKLTDAENSARKLIAILCAAGIGGVLPTIAKLAGNYVASSNPVLPNIGLYLGLALFFALGAAVAFMMKEQDARKAMILGIAAPGIITNMLAGASQVAPSQSAASEDAGSWLGISTAHAQAASETSPQLTIVPVVKGADIRYASAQVTLEFVTRDKQVLSKSVIDPRMTTTLTVPDGAYAVRAQSAGKSGDTKLPPSPYTSADLLLEVEFSRRSDFLWALGSTSRAKVDDVDVAIANVRQPELASALVPEQSLKAGTEVVTVDGTRVGVVDSVKHAAGKSLAVVVRPEL